MRTKYIRTKFLTGHHIQRRYLGLLLVSMVVPAVVVGACLYYLIFNIIAEQIGIPEYIAFHLTPVVNKINFILLVSVPPLFILLIMWGVSLSHRFTGPIERLEKELHRIADHGHYNRRIKLRKNDDIQPIAEAVNKLLDKIEGKAKNEDKR